MMKPDIKFTTSVDSEIKELVREIAHNSGDKTFVGNAADVIKEYMLSNAKPLEKD